MRLFSSGRLLSAVVAAEVVCSAAQSALPTVKNAACHHAVSIKTGQDNTVCMALCDTLITDTSDNVFVVVRDATFSASCSFETYTVGPTDTAIRFPDDSCFHPYTYGHSEISSDATFEAGLFTETPAQCQALCQARDTCAHWSWVSTLSTEKDMHKACLLQTEAMIKGALAVTFSAGSLPVVITTGSCNAGIPIVCALGGMECLTCGTKLTCVWNAKQHVAGWRSCAKTVELCHPFEELAAVAPQTVTNLNVQPTRTATQLDVSSASNLRSTSKHS